MASAGSLFAQDDFEDRSLSAVVQASAMNPTGDDPLKALIEALREELTSYGEMLALLDRQQESLRSRATEEIAQSVNQVWAQGAAILQARNLREERFRAVARNWEQPENTTFAELIPALPADYQPLLEALVEENNELLFRVRRRARQNHLMLRKSVEMMQQLLNSLISSQRATARDIPAHAPLISPAPLCSN